MLSLIISAILLGLVGGIIPGPVLTATFTEILQSGLLKSFRIILLALLIETIVALISLTALSSMHFNQGFFHIISFIGAIILVRISISLWKVKKIDTEDKVNFSLGKITMMILANGMLWTVWITVCVPRALLLDQKIIFGSYLFLVIVQLGWFVSTSFVAILFSQFRKMLSHPKAIPVIFKIFSIAFIYFAADMIYKSIMFFIH
jgi:threonine/homoserine/homoserine lactone efflux protein